MSGNSYLLDTNIVLYLLAGDERLADILDNQVIFISFITELELLGYKGLTQKSIKIINEFISECSVIDINREIKSNTLIFRGWNNILYLYLNILGCGISCFITPNNVRYSIPLPR